jgi:predicted GNAT family N-acyltransferase
VTVGSVPEVLRAEVDDLDEVARVLAEAFSDYPWTRWTVDAREHQERIEGLQRLALERVGFPHGQVWTVSVAGTIEAAAIWMDSRSPVPERAWTDMAVEQRILEGDRHEESRAAEAAIAELRPERPHLYLGAVGTRTRSRRRGLGTAVLEPTLAAADHEEIPAVLETSSLSNLAFYGQLGFEVVHEVQIEGGPPVWAMLREPRGPK